MRSLGCLQSRWNYDPIWQVENLLVTTKTKTPDVQVEHLVRHRRDEREFAEIAFGVHRAIGAGADHPIRGWQCRGCPYADACGA